MRTVLLAILALLCLGPLRAQEPVPDPKPFDELIQGAERQEGLFPLYRTRKNDLYLEVTPAALEPGKRFHLQVTVAGGQGGDAGRVTVGDPVYDVVFRLQRVREQLLWQVIQTNFRAPAGSPAARSLARSFGDSTLAALRIESLPHPERQSVLVKLSDLLLSDFPGFADYFSQVFSRPFAFDKTRSFVGEAKTFPENVEIEATLHYTATRASINLALADARFVPVALRCSLIELKASDFAPRAFDSRVGYFTSGFVDLADDDPKESVSRHIIRWDLRRRPIIFWLDNAIPIAYRDAVRTGILSWNQAFEAIGQGSPIEVRQLGETEEIDPFDIRHNVVRWATSTGDAYAIAIPRINPLTGEILKADIRIDASFVGGQKAAFRLEDELKARGDSNAPLAPAAHRRCELGRRAMRDAAFAWSVRELRGEASPGEREKFVRQLLTALVAHEIGHALGLRHNFKGSAYADSETGLGASVMDYVPARLAPGKDYYLTAPGIYDRWAIAYGYGPEADLPKLVARAAAPGLAYASDEETIAFGFAPFAPDPTASRFDLGPDPLAFARERTTLVKTLLPRLLSKATPGAPWKDVRRKADLLLAEYLDHTDRAARYIGGLTTTRARKGDPGAPDAPLAVVPAAKQRQALAFLRDALFAAQPIPLSPAVQRALTTEPNAPFVGVDEALPSDALLPLGEVFRLQRRFVLRWLLAPGLLARLRDNERRVETPSQTLTINELFATLAATAFSDLPAPVLPAERRDFQRDFVDELATLYLKPNPRLPADAAALARHHLRQLAAQIGARLPAVTDLPTKAHLELLQERIQRTLRAQTLGE